MVRISRLDELVLQALGEESALFMSQPVKGTEIIMPSVELKDLGERTTEQIKLLFLEVIGEHKKVLLARYEDEDSEAARENNEKLDLVIFHLDKVGKLVEAL